MKFKEPDIVTREFLKLLNLLEPPKAKEFATSLRLNFRNIGRITDSIFNNSKPAIPPLLNGPEVLSPAFDKAKLNAKIFSKHFNFDDSSISLPAFFPRTNVEQHHFLSTPNLVMKVITELDSPKK